MARIEDFPQQVFVAIELQGQKDEWLNAEKRAAAHADVDEDRTVGVYTLKEVINVQAKVETTVLRSPK